ncbi:MAG TPA: metallopeptidase TldD-related protein [Candidatus Polarisedimenticolia bacterium]|nr:metallopeptidase TldD-related protein [Candidatus Polarisedimenticolia bacterium]
MTLAAPDPYHRRTMIVSVDTELLRKILAGALPAGARSAELFVESRLTTLVSIDGASGAESVELRWETGAHLRRFSEGRVECFVLDAPTPASLEALALHPEAAGLEWLSGDARLGVGRPGRAGGLEARLPEASPGAAGGAWSAAGIAAALDLARQALGRLSSDAGEGCRATGSAGLQVQVQEVLVLATDRDPVRDTRRFAELRLQVELQRAGRRAESEATLSVPSLEALGDSGRPHETLAAGLAARAARRLDAGSTPRGEMPVVFASPSGGFLLHEVCGHLLEADHVLRGASPFAGARGQAVASPRLTLADDGSIPAMRGSSLFDDEGASARRTPLIMEGTLVGFLSDRMTAFATDGISTGNGRRQSYRDAPMPRMTNLVIDPGSETLDDILGRTPAGLLVTRLGRGRVDPATGRFALAVEEGYAIEGGRAGRPVAGAVLRGVARELLAGIDAVGSDPTADAGAPVCIKDDQAVPFGVLQPTLRVGRMHVAGAEP